jgi:ankyrin repeat protein
MSYSGTTLRRASAAGDAEVVLANLNAGIKVDDKDELGYTALHYACRSDKIKMENIVTVLVDHGADVNAKTNNGVTALHICCLMRKPRQMDDEGNEIDTKATRLAAEILQSKIRILEDLLSHGANPMVRDNSGICPLHLAAHAGVQESVQALLRATTTRIPARNGKQELFSAPYVKVCDRFGKNAAAWALLGKQKDTYNLLFLAEFGFAFEALFEQLVDHGAVDAGIIQKEYGLTNQELRMLEKFVAKSCTLVTDENLIASKIKEIQQNKAISDSTRLAQPSADAIEEIQEMMRKRGGHQQEEPLQIDTTKMEAMRKIFLQLKHILLTTTM